MPQRFYSITQRIWVEAGFDWEEKCRSALGIQLIRSDIIMDACVMKGRGFLTTKRTKDLSACDLSACLAQGGAQAGTKKRQGYQLFSFPTSCSSSALWSGTDLPLIVRRSAGEQVVGLTRGSGAHDNLKCAECGAGGCAWEGDVFIVAVRRMRRMSCVAWFSCQLL